MKLHESRLGLPSYAAEGGEGVVNIVMNARRTSVASAWRLKVDMSSGKKESKGFNMSSVRHRYKVFGDYAILALRFGFAPSGGI
jgi:hypothetical protein